VAHPARIASATGAPARAIADNAQAPFGAWRPFLGWVFLEIAVALVIAVAIVWWTLPRKPKASDEKDEP
jgi:hypothetical protein